ncbi:hypothetical protein GQ54DRAFT_305062 [Martensiomyces pterosporus]|nr:hypothetical protein GQ54DRAFT_305062 [Martensiomyces pterosporus]
MLVDASRYMQLHVVVLDVSFDLVAVRRRTHRPSGPVVDLVRTGGARVDLAVVEREHLGRIQRQQHDGYEQQHGNVEDVPQRLAVPPRVVQSDERPGSHEARPHQQEDQREADDDYVAHMVPVDVDGGGPPHECQLDGRHDEDDDRECLETPDARVHLVERVEVKHQHNGGNQQPKQRQRNNVDKGDKATDGVAQGVVQVDDEAEDQVRQEQKEEHGGKVVEPDRRLVHRKLVPRRAFKRRAQEQADGKEDHGEEPENELQSAAHKRKREERQAEQQSNDTDHPPGGNVGNECEPLAPGRAVPGRTQEVHPLLVHRADDRHAAHLAWAAGDYSGRGAAAGWDGWRGAGWVLGEHRRSPVRCGRGAACDHGGCGDLRHGAEDVAGERSGDGGFHRAGHYHCAKGGDGCG